MDDKEKQQLLKQAAQELAEVQQQRDSLVKTLNTVAHISNTLAMVLQVHNVAEPRTAKLLRDFAKELEDATKPVEPATKERKKPE